MHRRLRQFWPIIFIAVAAAAVPVVYIFVDRHVNAPPDLPPDYSKIDEGLWQGGYVSAPPPGTQAVVNLCETKDPYEVASYRWVNIPDAPPAPSLDWLRKQVEFVETERNAGRTVYIHCRAGISRSSLVTVAYLMKRDGSSRDRALEFVRASRPKARPNPAFMELLLEWERSLK